MAWTSFCSSRTSPLMRSDDDLNASRQDSREGTRVGSVSPPSGRPPARFRDGQRRRPQELRRPGGQGLSHCEVFPRPRGPPHGVVRIDSACSVTDWTRTEGQHQAHHRDVKEGQVAKTRKRLGPRAKSAGRHAFVEVMLQVLEASAAQVSGLPGRTWRTRCCLCSLQRARSTAWCRRNSTGSPTGSTPR